MKPTKPKQHKKPDNLEFLKICSLKLRFSRGSDPIYFYPEDMITRTGDLEICSLTGRLPDKPAELAQMSICWVLLYIVVLYGIPLLNLV